MYFKATSNGMPVHGTLDKKISDYTTNVTVTQNGKAVAIKVVDINVVHADVKTLVPDAQNIVALPYPISGNVGMEWDSNVYAEGRIAFSSGNSRGEVFCSLPSTCPEAYILKYIVEVLSPAGIEQVNIKEVAYNADLPPEDQSLRKALLSIVTDTYSKYLKTNNERVSTEETDTWPVKVQASRDYTTDSDSAEFLAGLADPSLYSETTTILQKATAMSALILDKYRQSMTIIRTAEVYRREATNYVETSTYNELMSNGQAWLDNLAKTKLS
jgi:hypothetical protein